MRSQRVLALTAVAFSCLAGSAVAQYKPYGSYPQTNYYSPPSYSNATSHYNPYYANPYGANPYGANPYYSGYPRPSYGYMPQGYPAGYMPQGYPAPYAAPYVPSPYAMPPAGAVPLQPAPLATPALPPTTTPKAPVEAKPAGEKSKAAKASSAKVTAKPASRSSLSNLFRWKTTSQTKADADADADKAKTLPDLDATPAPVVSTPACDKCVKEPAAAGASCRTGSCRSGSCSKGDCGGGWCDRHERQHCWYAEAGVVMMQPRWHNNPAFLTQTGAAPTLSTQTHFDYDWSAAPRIEAGFAGSSGLGIRGRYLRFDDDQTLTTMAVGTTIAASPLGLTSTADAGETLTATSRLQLDVVDFEVTQRWQPNCSWWMLFSAGGRYARLEQDYNFTELNADGTTDTLNSALRFSGGGLTAAMELHRRLGTSAFSLYAVGRGSILYGRFEQTVTQTEAGAAFASASKSGDDFLPIAELEAGIGWARPCKHLVLFANFGVTGQVYFGAGNSSDSSTSFNGIAGAIDPSAQSRQDLSFLGLSVTAGIRF